MDHQFREIRKGERENVLGFAKEQGSAIKPETLRHHMSLVVKADDDTFVAAGLCVERSPAQYVIEISHGENVDDALITELTDRCLRKMQSEGIASARINSPAKEATQTIWDQANWLDRIQETPPPTEESSATEPAPSQAA
jgi:hypothetical protein